MRVHIHARSTCIDFFASRDRMIYHCVQKVVHKNRLHVHAPRAHVRGAYNYAYAHAYSRMLVFILFIHFFSNSPEARRCT